MAIGNIQYGQAAQKDPYMETCITASWLTEEYEKCDEVPSAGIKKVSVNLGF
jgi:hypothetical protein